MILLRIGLTIIIIIVVTLAVKILIYDITYETLFVRLMGFVANIGIDFILFALLFALWGVNIG